MVKTEKKELPKCLTELIIEVEDKVVQEATEITVAAMAKEAKIPGFRPGKAPKHIIEKNFGKAAIFQKALDDLLPKIYSESLIKESIEPIGQPEINIKSTEPLVIEAKIPTKPIINLGEYNQYHVEQPAMPDADPLVEQSIQTLKRQYGTLEPVDRPVEWGDSVRIDFDLKIEGVDRTQTEEDAEFLVEKESQGALPGFFEELIGKERNQNYEFAIKIPKEFEIAELSNKNANYKIKIKEIKKSILPELNDEFVTSLESDVKTVKDLKDKLKNDVVAKLEEDQKAKYREEIINFFVAKSEMEFPEMLIEREIDRMIDQQSNHASHTPQGLKKWLDNIGKDENEVREMFREPAEVSVKRSLVLSEIIDLEKIEATDEDLELEIAKIKLSPSYALNPEQGKLDEILNTDDFNISLKNQILTNKAWELLESIALNQKTKSKTNTNKSKKTSKKNTTSTKNKKTTKK
ncbi:MAG: trigger factor [Dehalococcoidaceae bacterium]|nr:trigger factor [Dehalococcoidaceae bacterium]